MNSNSIVTLEVLEEHEKIVFYTLRFNGDVYSETDKFFLNHNGNKKYLKGIDIISSKIDKLGKSGCEERHFRIEGKYSDRVCALPDKHTDKKTDLRLYGIRLNSEIVIFGNGGYKITDTYNEDVFLNECVENLQKVYKILRSRLIKGHITIQGKYLVGNLSFKL